MLDDNENEDEQYSGESQTNYSDLNRSNSITLINSELESVLTCEEGSNIVLDFMGMRDSLTQKEEISITTADECSEKYKPSSEGQESVVRG